MLSQTVHIDNIISSNPHFTVSPTSFDLPPASNQAVTVTYTPTAAQTDTGTLSIYSAGNPVPGYFVHLTGTGVDIALAPVISSIKDVPNDDGKQVRVIWYPSIADDSLAGDKATEYSIWRRVDDPLQKTANVPLGVSSHSSNIAKRVMVDGTLWDFIVTVPAVQFEKYSFVAPTLRNANPSTFNWAIFRVAVHTAAGAFYFSLPDSGYSLDNIVPPPPSALTAVMNSTRIVLGWNKSDATDIEQYNVYRSTAPTVVPSAFLRVGTSNTTAFTDSTVLQGSTYYFTITAVDSAGNESGPTGVTSVSVGIMNTFSMSGGWNLISVPLIVNDFTKTTLYPNATSEAFDYEGHYVSKSTLVVGTGYWLRFSGTQIANLTGLLLTSDTIDVQTGWNMIGSISQPVAVTSILSVPPALVTSPFFCYKGGYITTDSIRPGSGYWVKISRSGQLIVSSIASPGIPARNRIRIVATSELPPPPPDEFGPTNGVPKQFALEQNFPNPFNPATEITYMLPVKERVVLKVYNMLGQEVMTLVNELQDAGYKSVTFDADRLPSGVYSYRLTAGAFRQVKRMILLK